MIEEICRANGIAPWTYREHVKGDRYLIRTMVLTYWREKKRITSEQWLSRCLIEALADYKRKTGRDGTFKVYVS